MKRPLTIAAAISCAFVLALALSYAILKNQGDTHSYSAARVFKAPRQGSPGPLGAGGSSPGSGQEDGPSDAVVEALHGVLSGVREGRREAADRAAYVSALEEALASESMGKPSTRLIASEEAVDAILKADAGRPLAGAREDLVWRLAEGFARDITARLDGGAFFTSLKKLPEVKAPRGYAVASWEVLKGYEHVPGVAPPAEVLALDGAKVAINGYMVPLGEEERSRSFLIVSSLWDCCFGAAPKINHGIVVEVVGEGVKPTDFPVMAAGRLSVGEEREDGEVVSVYGLSAEVVEVLRP